jgi:putative membrane protein
MTNQHLTVRGLKIEKIAIYTLIAFHFFGVLGVNLPLMNECLAFLTPYKSFISLTPLNLLITCGLLLSSHTDWRKEFVFFCLACAMAGVLVEMIGVHTGVIFGVYVYGGTLGWKIYDVPLTIGVNWLILTYSTSMIAHRYINKYAGEKHSSLVLIFKAMAAATLMTALDTLIEPFAVRYDFWTWADGIIPIQNFVAWWLVSFLLCLYGLKVIQKMPFNKLAVWVYGLQVFFFAANNILM